MMMNTTTTFNQRKAACVKRVFREIYLLNKNPHPNFSIFPLEERVTFWNLILQGPQDSPYENHYFRMYIEFPEEEYPFTPPECRFISSIFHCNVNEQGRICHSIFGRNYSVDLTVRQMFDEIFALLKLPEIKDSIAPHIAHMQYFYHEEYERKCRDYTQKYAIKTY